MKHVARNTARSAYLAICMSLAACGETNNLQPPQPQTGTGDSSSTSSADSKTESTSTSNSTGTPADPANPTPVGQNPPTSGTPTPTPSTTLVKYADIQSKILTPKCVMCHGPGGSMSGKSLVDYAKTMANGGFVIAKNSAGSKLYTSVNKTGGGQMPPSQHLTVAEVALIRDWIDQGALNN